MPKLTVYYTSDMHGFVFPTTHADHEVRPMGLLGMIPEFHKDGNTLILDCGDTIQGSPLTYYCHKKSLLNPMIPVINAAGYDYVTLGNHDFNYGYEALSEYLNGIKAKCVCANVKDRSGRLPIVPFVLHTMENGLRVGLTGIVTDWVNRWEQEATLSHFEIKEPFYAAQKALEAMKGRTDVTICLYHGGVEKDLDTGRPLTDSDENIACRLCEELDFDLLLTGHQHIPLENKMVHGTHLAQPPANATHFLKIEMDERNFFTSKLISSDFHIMPPVAKTLEELKNALDEWLDSPIGKLNMPLKPGDKLSMALHGAPIANFINQVQLEASGADLSCTSLPNEMRGFEKSVTVRDVVATYVYANTLVVLEVDGSILKEVLERCASYFDVSPGGQIGISSDFQKPKVAHYNYDYFAGIEYTFDLGRPMGSRVSSMKRNGKEILPKQKFSLCMNNYRSSGVGGYDAYLRCPHLKEINMDVSELILNYLLDHRQVTVWAESPLKIKMP